MSFHVTYTAFPTMTSTMAITSKKKKKRKKEKPVFYQRFVSDDGASRGYRGVEKNEHEETEKSDNKQILQWHGIF